MKKNYKIALIVGTLTCGGLERVVANYSQLFEKEGHKVTVFILDSGVEYPFSGKLNTYAIKTFSFFQKIKRYFQLKKDLRKGQFDIIIDHRVRLNPWAEMMWKYLIFHKERVLYFVHSSKIEHYLQPYHKILSFIFRKDLFICVSKGIEKKINTIFPTLKTKTIYNPVFFPTFIEEKISHQHYVMAIARITVDNVKQIDVMLECYAESQLPKKGIKLLILGDGERKHAMEQYAKQLGIGENVEFKGFITNPYPYLKNAYCTLLTSKYEGLGMVLIESLLCGTPVIAFDCESGPSEIIEHYSNGLLVENQNKEAFIQALNKILIDKILYQRMKNNTKSSVEKFTSKQIMNEWSQLFSQILNDKS